MPARSIRHDDLVRGAKTSDLSRVGKVSAESVRKHTGKDWKEWVDLLRGAGAGTWSYQEIVSFLKKKHRLAPWWQQGVALGFEIATGRRAEGQDSKGRYMVTATKSMPLPVRELWKLLTSRKGLGLWLRPLGPASIRPKSEFETQDGFFGEIRTVAPNRRIRIYWRDPSWESHTVVELLLVPRPGSKSILVFNHTAIRDAKIRDSLRARWRKAADEIHSSVT